MWKCLISRFLENVNTRERLSFSFPEIWDSPWKIHHQKIYQNLTNRTRWNKRDIVWTYESSLFKSKLAIISIGSIGSSRLCACFELWSRRHGKLLFFRGQTEKPMKSLARSSYQCEIKDEACSSRSTDAWGTYIHPGEINIGFWKTAHLPLPLPNILP